MMAPLVIIKNVYDDPPVFLYLMSSSKSSNVKSTQITPTTLFSYTAGKQTEITLPIQENTEVLTFN